MSYCTTFESGDLSFGGQFKSEDAQSIHSTFEDSPRTALEHSSVCANVVHAVSTIAQSFSNDEASNFVSVIGFPAIDFLVLLLDYSYCSIIIAPEAWQWRRVGTFGGSCRTRCSRTVFEGWIFRRCGQCLIPS